MGRTFGLLIVSVGLWLVVSLPTRDPGAEQPSVAAIGRATATLAAPAAATISPTSAVTPAQDVPQRRETATAVTLSPSTMPPSAQRHEAKEGGRSRSAPTDRTMAARGREMESEPEAVRPVAPEPVLVTIATAPRAAGTPSATVHEPLPVVPTPMPVSASNGTQRQQGEQQRAVRSASQVEGGTLTSSTFRHPVQGPGLSGTTPIQPPRIMEQVRRDLTTPAVALQAPVAKPKADEAPRPAVKVADTTTVAKSGSDEKPAGAGAKIVKKPAAPDRKVAVVREPRPAPAQAPRQHRVQVAYAPPAYVGRIVVRSAPPGMFVPSSGSFKRIPFRSETMWDTLRRTGM